MLRWDVAATRDVPPVVTVASRPWSRLDVDLLRSAISTSRLCQPDTWPADIDAMAALYNDEFSDVLDSILPVRVFTRRPRPTDPWFDRECRDAKRTTRRLVRAFASASRRAASAVAAPLDGTASGVTATADIAKAAKAAWYNQRRLYRQLRRNKCSDY